MITNILALSPRSLLFSISYILTLHRAYFVFLSIVCSLSLSYMGFISFYGLFQVPKNHLCPLVMFDNKFSCLILYFVPSRSFRSRMRFYFKKCRGNVVTANLWYILLTLSPHTFCSFSPFLYFYHSSCL